MHGVSSVLRRFLGVFALAIAGCADETPIGPAVSTTQAATGARVAASLVPPAKRGMGDLDGIAQHIARAIQDSATRQALRRALLADENRGALDLSECEGKGVAARLSAFGERRGGVSVATHCAAVRRFPGMILFMDRRQLAVWDGTTLPIVTGLANASAATPANLMGYRSPETLISIGADRHLAAPILVVVPIPHPRRLRAMQVGGLPAITARSAAAPTKPVRGNTGGRK
jgi:hypothetical protein